MDLDRADVHRFCWQLQIPDTRLLTWSSLSCCPGAQPGIRQAALNDDDAQDPTRQTKPAIVVDGLTKSNHTRYPHSRRETTTRWMIVLQNGKCAQDLVARTMGIVI